MARRGKRNVTGFDRSWMRYRECGLCERPYVSNNYQDHKTRITRWKGVEICARCRYVVIPLVKSAMDLKIIKYRKKYR